MTDDKIYFPNYIPATGRRFLQLNVMKTQDDFKFYGQSFIQHILENHRLFVSILLVTLTKQIMIDGHDGYIDLQIVYLIM
jgi:hypothetical protein